MRGSNHHRSTTKELWGTGGDQIAVGLASLAARACADRAGIGSLCTGCAAHLSSRVIPAQGPYLVCRSNLRSSCSSSGKSTAVGQGRGP